ncbi:hypothetical protein [Thalassotalea profundi]|uniref:DUF3545 family protein n=1 Tax=Thalassotalea profundi TaxID=2036687 RepID=A0ABQ3ILR2_9GAMM|nr:hypothetical protein [Thalassotalea profundi]GHE85583.1 hypothetical protein GCM10011501_13310 [Thalassotalea profundi]
MNIDLYDDNDIDIDDDLNLDSGIAGFEIAYGTPKKAMIRRTVKQKHRIREKLESLCEKRRFDRETNTLSDYWDRH